MEPVNAFVWGPVMLALLLGAGLYFSLGTGFLQIRRFGAIFRATFGSLFHVKQSGGGGITPFQAVSTALASTMGTGNIVGVATALVAGGPGAVFWMWVSALLGMMTKYAEVVLALRYRRRDREGQWAGGPMYTIRHGMGRRFGWLAAAFALFGILASFGSGNMAQVNSMAGALLDAFSIPPAATGLLSVVGVGLVIFGGISQIAKVSERLIPFLSIAYTAGALAVIVFHHRQLGAAFASIWGGAFGLNAAAGGALGYTLAQAVRIGLSRGVFSNEAGLGSAPIAHAAAEVKQPVEQGFWGAVEVFVDTIVSCTVTALAILCAGLYAGPDGPNGAVLTGATFATLFGGAGKGIVAVAVTLFAYSSILGWNYYGEKCCEYLFPRKANVGGTPRLLYRLLFLAALFFGATGGVTQVWTVADACNGLMAVPNLISLVWLSGTVFAETRGYFRN
jgi:AGCS family alanine or glycine:cation symporter